MTVLRLAAGVVISLLVASLAFPDPDRPIRFTDPSLLALITNDDSFATVDLTTLLDPAGYPTQHYGPYSSMSPDSGTCGNDWATDTFDRHFTVKLNPDGSHTLVEQFKNGSFTTAMGASPGACETTPTPQGTVAGGKTGGMHGYFIVPIPAPFTQTSSDSSCVVGMPLAPCTTAGFINTHFDCTYLATCSVSTFFFHYGAGDQMLIEHEWKNASSDRGGNSGDIRSMNVP
jgi:hypothetical protein